MAILQYQDDHGRAAWKSCMASAFRTALACTIVACITLYGPISLKNQIALPAFSYVTVILIVTDATLGDALRGCWHALQASVFGACPAILSLWLMGPTRLTAGTTAAAVAVSAFAVVLPENTHLISKRIALGQIVLVYFFAFIKGSETEPIMHPIHVLASTAVGVVACVLALLFPYPNLACYEVQKKFKLYTKNAAQRLGVFLKAFSAEDKTSAQALILQSKPLANTGTKLLRSIKSKQESMLWERLPVKFLKPCCKNPGEKLQDLETPLRGMEIALSDSGLLIPVSILNSELKDDLAKTEEHISRQIKSMPLVSATTVPEENAKSVIESLQTLQNIPLDQKELPSFFFLFCLKLLQKKSITTPPISNEGPADSLSKKEWFFKRIWRSLVININSSRLIPAFKCSLSLGLSVFLGSLYSKENGYWAGLPVAISLASAREGTFKVANIKAQGTVLGTIYGVLGCFVFEKYVHIRFISLFPWFIFCSFLRRSRMYGQAGGISAVIGAVLILGRENFGLPSEFAIARIVETFIGLSCSVMVELLLQPTRASALAKVQLSKNFEMVLNSICEISLGSSKANLEESLKELNFQVNELGKFIGEAEVEPNFWFLPFHSACYGKLLESLSKMVGLLVFTSHANEILQKEYLGRIDHTNFWEDCINKLNVDLKILKDMIGSSIKCFEEVSLVKSLEYLDKEIERRNISLDLESGKMSKLPISSDEEMIIKKNMSSYIQHCNELLDGIHADKGEELKSHIALSLSCVGFCMSGLLKETKEIEKAIEELVQWENPSGHVNLHDISCKIRALAAAASDTYNHVEIK
ncbi:hypothetical protein ACH5RR_020804 [Cinchona calisaya]|uniref:Integral membrane bound transporter domain-containing protein n=1 Tax=Cinchona calisaya TaxID=153742 RepID=A0ABD2ZIU5_9GENT